MSLFFRKNRAGCQRSVDHFGDEMNQSAQSIHVSRFEDIPFFKGLKSGAFMAALAVLVAPT